MPSTPSAARPTIAARLAAGRDWFLARPSTRQAHFDALDGLRGVAVLVVIASHMALLGWLPGIPVGGVGKAGVYLFFVLSAFLLTRLLLEREPRAFGDRRLWAAYALRRVLRIWPLYLVVLLSSWVLTRMGVGWHFALDDADLLRHLLLLEGESVLWSIPVEFKFYLWLPLVALGLAWMAWRRWHPLAQVAAGLSALVLATLAWPPGDTGVNDVRLGPYLVLFLCGGFSAAIDRHLGTAGRGAAGWVVAGALSMAAVAASIPAAWAALTGTPVDLRLSHQWFLFYGIAWSALLLSALHGPARWRRAFSVPPLRLLGVVSFSAYLWHMPVLDGLRALGAREWPGAGAWALAATMLVSMVSFLLVERPWRDVRLPSARARGPDGAHGPDGKIRGPSDRRSPT